MAQNWEKADQALQSIEVIGNENNEPVTIVGFSEDLRCIGSGTDAAVFYHDDIPGYAFKLYSDKALEKKELEEEIYKRLQGSRYFPECFGAGSKYLVLSYEAGPTLYDCLLQGIVVPEQVIIDVEEAREFVRSTGLNPRDIHLKNVIVQEGRGKVLDVSEYLKEGNDHRWEHLVWVYKHIYPMINGMRVPLWVLESIKHWYNRIDKTSFMIEDFSQRISKLFIRPRK
jgi:hypothetical protein